MNSNISVVLEAREVVRAYGDRPVLKAASLSLDAGTVTALLGPSGSGKSTLLRVLAGLDDLEAGSVVGGGETLSAPGHTMPPEDRGLGMVFQDFALFPHLTAQENIAFGLTDLPRAERNSRALELLKAAGLGDRADAHPFELSGGEQQRVAIARALAREPAAILLDEPFSNLDASLRRATRDHAMGLLRASGAAVLLVTHDVEEALSLADTVALMDGGQIIQTGTPEDVYTHPVSARAAQLTGDINVWRGRVERSGVRTPFGSVASTLPDGTDVQVLARPEALLVAPNGTARVTARRTLGASVELDLDAAGTLGRARVSYRDESRPGDGVAVSLDPLLTTVLPAAP
ncbi:MAG: ABC transporter ATP-binding protein [Alphaproteobacteria bacterium]